MKYFIVMVVALAALVAADEQWSPITEKETFHKIHDDCVKESGITPEQVEHINNMELPNEKEAREYTRCVGKGFGIFTDDQGYNLDRLTSQFGVFFADVEQIRDILTGCIDGNEQKSPPDEWSYRGQKCIIDSKIGDTLKESKRRSGTF